MTQLRNPLMNATDEDQKIYIAVLERRLVLHMTLENRLRAALEIATGQPWDSRDIIGHSTEDLMEAVADDMVKGLGILKQDAMRIVEENRVTANPTII